ncbi:MAG TPA: single-stranded DNA-binding protein [Candidatus Saccharimonadales bacterium]|nr:single-stranded DNA-binding protein [Candidatus Saccharimonadales bacterium]
MAGYNRIILVGNLTRDPELKQISSGVSVCRLGIATNRQFKNRQTGASMQEVCYVDIDVWGAQAESCSQYLAKGRPVLVEGRLKFDTWQDAQGATRSKHSVSADRVVFLSSSAPDAYDTAGAQANDQDQFATPKYETQDTQEFVKIEQAVAKKQAAKKAAAATEIKAKDKEVGGLPQFKDEPPFEDELPF